MRLETLLTDLSYRVIKGNLNQEVDSIIYDSRVKTKKGLFIAVKGFSTDGHRYIKSAIENGAKVVVLEEETLIEAEGITVIKMDDTRSAMANLAARFYNHPSTELDLVGVTGTNGKTSITFLLGQILEAYAKKIGIIGTIENRIGDTVLQAQRTTPESVDLQQLLRRMVKEEVSHCLMEVSSHALELGRVAGCQFKVGLFTNLTQDHLDFHHTMDAYAAAKAKLFNICEVGVINIDSEYAPKMMEKATCRLVTYGIDHKADYHAKDIVITAQGVTYMLETPDKQYEVYVPIPGKFSVYNSMAVIVAAVEIGIPMEHILKTLQTAKGVPGRVQSFTSPKGYSVLVDYAHTPDGLENVLQTITQFAKGNIITVFGCGGDRDRTKRPLMGAVAAKYSHKVIITSDNPRSEEPSSILDEVEVGVKEHSVDYIKMVDRKEAIYQALTMASQDDVVLIAGKGHENYQILKDCIIHFDDAEIVQDFMQGEM